MAPGDPEDTDEENEDLPRYVAVTRSLNDLFGEEDIDEWVKYMSENK